MRRWGVDVIVVEPGDYTTGEKNIYIIYIYEYTWKSQISTVIKMIGYVLVDQWFLTVAGTFLFATTSILPLGLTQPPVQ
jgi:hypothetical protein